MCFNALLNATSLYLTKLSKNFLKNNLMNFEKDDFFINQNDLDLEKRKDQNNLDFEKRKDQKKDLENEENIIFSNNLKERLIDLNIPENINYCYEQLYDLFGESILQYIPFDIINLKNSINFSILFI
jgi:hypothetical protein